MLSRYAASGSVRFHMPSHKGTLSPYDITELDFSDNLQNEQGVIAASEEIFARTFGADRAFYSVNGSTAGIYALLKSAEGKILIERNSHISVFRGLELLKKDAVVVNNDWKNNRLTPLRAEQVKKAVEENPEIGTVFLTYPDYYGCCCELEQISEFLKQKGILLFADSAHGAHFGLSPLLPPHAIRYCNACVVSAHKTLGALTQSAAVLSDWEHAPRVKENLNLFISTSPSYLLLASIEIGLDRVLRRSSSWDDLEEEIGLLKKTSSAQGSRWMPTDDFTRAVLDAAASGFDSAELFRFLSDRGIYAECYDKNRIVFLSSVFHEKEDFVRLNDALSAAADVLGKKETKEIFWPQEPYGEARQISGRTKKVPLSRSVGKISAVNAGIYPPAVPVLLKGEKITKAKLDFLRDFSDNLFGIEGKEIEIFEDGR